MLREWIDLAATDAFLPAKHCLLVSRDNRQTFCPDPLAPFVNAKWRQDFNLLGRLVGVALYHHANLNLPLHPHLCRLLLAENKPWEVTPKDLVDIDPDLYKNKVLHWCLY